MTSVICPICKGHISEWDVICLSCGHSVSPEERKKLVKEHEEMIAHDHELKNGCASGTPETSSPAPFANAAR